MPRGRPSKYKPEFNKLARNAAKTFNATDPQLAELFGVATSTISKWKAEIPEFSEALNEGKKETDNDVERSLYERAMGYSHEAVKIFCNKDGLVTEVPYIERFPPDTTACIFWLKNRDKENWRDKQEVEHGGKVDLTPVINLTGKK